MQVEPTPPIVFRPIFDCSPIFDDVRTSRFEGHCTSPTLLDDAVKEGMVGTLSIDDGETFDVTLIAARSSFGRKGIGKMIEDEVGHSVVLEAVRQE